MDCKTSSSNDHSGMGLWYYWSIGLHSHCGQTQFTMAFYPHWDLNIYHRLDFALVSSSSCWRSIFCTIYHCGMLSPDIDEFFTDILQIGTFIQMPLYIGTLTANLRGRAFQSFGTAIQLGIGNCANFVASNVFIVSSMHSVNSSAANTLSLSLPKHQNTQLGSELALELQQLHYLFNSSSWAVLFYITERLIRRELHWSLDKSWMTKWIINTLYKLEAFARSGTVNRL